MSEARSVAPLVAPLDTVVSVPGSKSIANRALVCAALADGISELGNVPDGDDTVAMVDCLGRLGLDVRFDPPAATARVTGTSSRWPAGEVTLHAGLAGTTSRFVTALAALGHHAVTVDGEPPLQRRPFGPLQSALSDLGVRVEPAGQWGTLPVTVTGPPTSGSLDIAGDVSSQYITALMLIGPMLPGGLRLEITSELVSRPYVEMTAAVMAGFGAEGIAVGERHVNVEPGGYTPTEFAIEPDASSASYPLALAAVCGGRVSVEGLGQASLQGDAAFAELLAEMGCGVSVTDDRTTVQHSLGAELHGIDVDMADMSDLVPTLAAVALFAGTPSRITGVGFIRNKESDRLGAFAAELRAAGGDIVDTDDGLEIRPSADRLRGARLATHHDHRLAMAFGVVGSRVPGIEVIDPGVVSKSWPGFWEMLERIAP